MNNTTKLAKFAEQAEILALKVLVAEPQEPACPDGFPTSGGVYLISNEKGEAIYVGKARNLRRRICTDHLSQESRDTMSAFRRTVNKQFWIPFGPEMREWVINNCRFSYLEIPDADMRSVVESLLIASLRSEALLNKS